MDEITRGIWLGNSHDAIHSRKELKENGITAILNCAWDLKNTQLSHKDGFEIAQCGLRDSKDNNVFAIYSAVLQLANLVKNNHFVLVHCHEGRSRSAWVVAYYLYAIENFDTIEEAFDYIVSCRPEVYNPPREIKESFDKCNVDLLKKMFFNRKEKGE